MEGSHIPDDEVRWAIDAAGLDLAEEPFGFAQLQRGIENELQLRPRAARSERTPAIVLAATLIAVSRLRHDLEHYARLAQTSAVSEAARAVARETGFGVVHHRPVDRHRREG